MNRFKFIKLLKKHGVTCRVGESEYRIFQEIAPALADEIVKLMVKYKQDKIRLSFNYDDFFQAYPVMFASYFVNAVACRDLICFNPLNLESNLHRMLDTMIHEFCHILQYRFKLPTEEITARVPQEEYEYCVSEYAKTEIREMQAEAFILFEKGTRNDSVLRSLRLLLPHIERFQ